jgi:macrolide transport system ATP-binding/permease protein
MLRDFRHGLRLVRRTPGFTSIAIRVLALGIGVNTAVFSLVNALVLQPRPGRIDQLVGVFSRDRNKPDHYRDFSYPAYVDLRSRADVFESVMAHTFSTVGIAEGPDGSVTKQTFAAIVSANYFSTLGSLSRRTPSGGGAASIASWRASCSPIAIRWGSRSWCRAPRATPPPHTRSSASSPR